MDGVSGKISFTGVNVVLNVYYQQTFEIGASESTLRITKVTATATDSPASSTYWADGIITVNGVNVVTMSLRSSTSSLGLTRNVERDINNSSGATTVAQQYGSPTQISIGIKNNYAGTFFIQKASDGSRKHTCGNLESQITLDQIPQQYTLAIASNNGASVSVYRTSSKVGASIGNIGSGNPVYSGDVLSVSYTLLNGYVTDRAAINGVSFSPPRSIIVNDDVDIVVYAKLQGAVWIDGEMYLVFIDDGVTFLQYIPEYDDGGAWNICS